MAYLLRRQAAQLAVAELLREIAELPAPELAWAPSERLMVLSLQMGRVSSLLRRAAWTRPEPGKWGGRMFYPDLLNADPQPIDDTEDEGDDEYALRMIHRTRDAGNEGDNEEEPC